MRKLIMFIVIGMLLTFLAHGIMGSFKLMGADADALKTVAWISMGFVTAHIIIVTILTVKTLYARHKSGAGYFKGNGIFWARRISGFAIIIPLIMHIVIFTPTNQDVMRLAVFTAGRLVSQILLVLTITLHVITNAKPALITMGIKGLKKYTFDILFILSLIMLFFAVAFAIYYFRWMAV